MSHLIIGLYWEDKEKRMRTINTILKKTIVYLKKTKGTIDEYDSQ
jgi:radical SAM superfamily enzyme